jgi:hypothetical protein
LSNEKLVVDKQIEPQNQTLLGKFFNWYNYNGIVYLDSKKSGSFYIKTRSLLISVLLPTKRLGELSAKQLQIQVNLTKLNNNSQEFVHSQIINAGINQPYVITSTHYTYATIRVTVPVNENINLNQDKLKITYSLRLNNIASDTLNANVIHHSKAQHEIARLTKCLYLTDSPRAELDFEHLLNLTSRFSYDTIFICNFNDPRIHRILQSKPSVKEILLDSIPDFVTNASYFSHFSQIPSTGDYPFDVISEYLYNIIYPGLIDSFQHVFAGDFDQLVVPKVGQKVSEYLSSEMVTNMKLDSFAKSSIYIDQVTCLKAYTTYRS